MGNWPNTYLGLPLHENVEWTSLATLIEAVLPTSRDDKWCWLLENAQRASQACLLMYLDTNDGWHDTSYLTSLTLVWFVTYVSVEVTHLKSPSHRLGIVTHHNLSQGPHNSPCTCKESINTHKNQSSYTLVTVLWPIYANKAYLINEVNTLLSAARMRLHNAREEREHFDEASNQILVHLKTKEDELFKSVASYKVEATAVNACKNFLEHTWNLQISQRQQKEEHVDGELEKYGNYFVKLVISLLSSYKGKLEPSLSCIRKLEENLSSMKESDVSPNIDDRSLNVYKQRRKLEEEYLDMESKFVSILSTVDTVRMQFYETKGVVRNLDKKVQETFDALEKVKQEFESIKRPKLLIETVRRKPELPVNEKPHIVNSSPAFTSEQTAEVRRLNFEELDESLAKRTKNFSMEAEMAKLDSDEGVDTVDSNEEINDWEFDELGRDYDSTSNHQRR